MDYENLQGKDGSFENSPGTEQVIYFAPVRDFKYMAEPKLFAEITLMGEAVLVGIADDDHLLKLGKKWTKLRLLMNTGKVVGETVGDRGSRSVKTQFEATYIGSTREIYGLQRFAKEDEYIILAPHADGTVQQIGTMVKPALMTLVTDTGQEEEGVKGASILVEATNRSNWVYDGAISLEPAFYFQNALDLPGLAPFKTAFVYDADGDSSFGGWFDMDSGANDRHVLLSNTAQMELGVCMITEADGESPVLVTGDVYLLNDGVYSVFANISTLLNNSNHLVFTKEDGGIRLLLNGSLVNELNIGLMQFSAWTHLFGSDANSHYEGLVDQLFMSDPISDVNVATIYNNRKGLDPLGLGFEFDFYFSFNSSNNGDTTIANEGTLGGVLNIVSAFFVDFEPDVLP